MRTLKKSLSLVLVLAMVFSFCVMGTNAAFADQDEINAKYAEAVEVMNALEILKGDETGFRPDDTLTRAEACVIVVKMLGQLELAKTAKTDKFTDISGHWGEAYIAYCAEQGLISGIGDNKFGPDSELSGYAFALMILRACGYEPKNEGIGGTGWELATAKLAKEAELVAVMDLIAAETFTREMAAQMAFDGLLNVGQVTYAGGTNITIGDATISSGALRSNPGETLGEEVFTITNDAEEANTDKLGNPVVNYFINGQDLVTIAQDATVTFSNTPVDAKALRTALGLSETKYALQTVTVKTNGAAGALTDIGLGSEVNVYYNAIAKTIDVVVANPVIATVAKVTAAKDELPAYINLNTAAGPEFVTDEFAKDDVVVAVIASDNTVISVEAAEVVSGKLTKMVTKNGVTTYTIGGENYVKSVGYTNNVEAAWALKADVAFYADAYGNILHEKKVETAEEPANYMLVIEKAEALGGGLLEDKYLQVYGLLADGSYGTFELYGVDAVADIDVDTVIEYAVDSKGNMVYDDEVEAIAVTSTDLEVGATKIGSAYLNDDTVFMFVESKEDGSVKAVETIEGAKNVLTAITADYYVITETLPTTVEVVKYVIVAGTYTDPTAKDSKDYVYFAAGDTDIVETSEADKATVFTYTVYDANGDKVEVNHSTNTLTAGIYVLREDGTFNTTPVNKDGKITVVTSGVITVSGAGAGDYKTTSDTVIVDLTLTGNGKLDKDDNICFVANEYGVITLIYIV